MNCENCGKPVDPRTGYVFPIAGIDTIHRCRECQEILIARSFRSMTVGRYMDGRFDHALCCEQIRGGIRRGRSL